MSVYTNIPPPLGTGSRSSPPKDYRTMLLGSLDKLPPLATILNQLLQLINDTNSSASQISAIIEKDSVLSGNVLRCVNSAYCGLQSRVSGIRHAVTLLGFETLRNLALAFSMRRMLQKPSAKSKKLFAEYSQHALGCAIMTQFLAHYTHSEEVDAAFAAGLFHDVGRLLIITAAPEVLEPLAARRDEDEGSIEKAEHDILNITHSELSHAVLARWKLPEVIQQAARFHHAPDLAQGESEEEVSLAHLVHAADAYVNFQGLGIPLSEVVEPPNSDEAFETIGLSGRLPELQERFQSEFDSIRATLQ